MSSLVNQIIRIRKESFIPLLVLGVVLLYLYVYQYIIHHVKFKYAPTVSKLTKPCTRLRLQQPSTYTSILRAVFNPSAWVGGSQGMKVIARYTPGHQLTAGLSFLACDDLDLDYGFRSKTGVIFKPRALIYGSKGVELVYVPVNGYRWQGESAIWKQGEDIRLITGPNNTLMGMGVLVEFNDRGGGVSSRLGLGEFKYTSGKLCWLPTILLNKAGESDKNWTVIKREGSELFFLTDAFPRWRVVAVDCISKTIRETMDIDTSQIIKAMDIRISNYGRRDKDMLEALHLGGGEAGRFIGGRLLIALHTHRPYRTVFCEIDSRTMTPTRLSFPSAVTKEGAESFIELVTSVSELDDEHIILGVGLEDATAEIVVHKKSSIDKILKIECGK
jgi:hypothetical protein